MRHTLASLTLIILFGCGGGGGGSSSSSAPSNSGRNSGLTGSFSNPGSGGSTIPVNTRVLQLVDAPLPNKVKALEPAIRPLVTGFDFDAGIPRISADGRLVSFVSSSPNLVEGDNNGISDVFVRDRLTATTVRINYQADDPRTDGCNGDYDFSADLKWLVFTLPYNGGPPEFYLRNLETQETHTGTGFLTDLSPDGRYVAHWAPPNPTRTRLYDRLTHNSIEVDAGGNGDSVGGIFTPDGQEFYFYSESSNLVQGDTNGVGDVFSYRLSDGLITRVSMVPGGAQANGQTNFGRFSQDGRYYVFPSSASNWVAGDSNNLLDIFLQDRATGEVRLVSRALSGSANGECFAADISGDGRYVVFNSKASNLVENDTNNIADVFLYDRETQALGRISLTDRLREMTGGADLTHFVSISQDGKWIAFTADSPRVIWSVPSGFRHVYLTNNEIPRLYQPPGPHPNPYKYTLTGTASIPLDPFDISGAHSVSGSANENLIGVQVYVPGAVRHRQIRLNLYRGPAPLAVGTVIEFPYDEGKFDDVRLEVIDPGLSSPTHAFVSGLSGQLTITSLSPAPGGGTTVGVRLDDWLMVPDTRIPNNPASGSFRFNGTLTFVVP